MNILTIDGILPRVYDTPKIHKHGIPLRIIAIIKSIIV